jgi:manganese transport protein
MAKDFFVHRAGISGKCPIYDGARSVLQKVQTHPVKHIVATLGHDRADAEIISKALSTAKAEKALLTLLHVSDTAPGQIYGSEIYDEHTRADEQYLLEIAREIRDSGIPTEISLAFGDPAKEVIKFANTHDVDMLVMGSHGHRLLSDILFGETVDPVRHKVHIPVLVV